MKTMTSHRDQLYTEDVFRLLMEYEIIRSIRYPAPLSLIHLEMIPQASNGKAPASTAFLFETVLNARLRSADIPTRHGKGYLILLPTTDEAGARRVCERLLGVFDQKFQTEEGGAIWFVLQIGIAAHNGGPTLMKEALLETARRGLEQSRSKGANTIGAVRYP